MNNKLPIILIILDGWGISEPNKGNAITLAKTPVLDSLLKEYPNTKLHASGKHVGLPDGQPGNSEAGHMNIGAGRVVEQDMVRISKDINNGVFFKNAAFLEAVRHAKANDTKLHIMGMLSSGTSPHSDPDHILALIVLARGLGLEKIYLHLFTDGRDSPKYASLKTVNLIEQNLKQERIATVMGRFYAMDRTKKWDRTEKAYDAIVCGEGRNAQSAHEAITEGYNRGETDEFIEPYVITENGKQVAKIEDGDSIIFFNLRSDRARQLTKVFVQDEFNKKNPGSFKRKKVLKNIRFVAMTDFGPDLDSILSAYPSVDLKDTLPMQLTDLRQLYIAETEKYAHVTYFFNGGYTGAVAGEEQKIIPSPDVKFYNEVPEMSSKELAEEVVKNVNADKYDFTVLNFAAPDMVGHTGDLAAGIKCCEAVDGYLGEIVEAYKKKKGTVIITADHGNVEEMINLETGEIDTEHSTNSVPFILVNDELKDKVKLKEGNLGDVAPTILDILGIKKPKKMKGDSLIR